MIIRIFLLVWALAVTAQAGEREGTGSAENRRGKMYEEGKTVPQNYREARYLYLRAARMGNLDACVNLGRMYQNGIGIPPDVDNAARWFRKAAEQGHNEAQLQLGKLYAKGTGVPKDLILAHMWMNLATAENLEKASHAGEKFAKKSLEEFEKVAQMESKQASGATADRDDLAKQMTPEQIAKAQEMARTWKPRPQPARERNTFTPTDWPHWSKESGDCQNTREKMLIRHSLEPVAFETEPDCKVMRGKWLDPYHGKTMTRAADVGLDHVVPLAYASRHGGDLWPQEMKKKFANDFDNLQVTTSGTAREKKDNGPAGWKPPEKEAWCDYGYRWRNIVTKYGLSISQTDDGALQEMTATCSSGQLSAPQ
ncbi:MAG: sel1 repeat family protein [Magnetococcales bacterium]|nr:sel1 repeat family protein [Magnetococcales bacterium]